MQKNVKNRYVLEFLSLLVAIWAFFNQKLRLVLNKSLPDNGVFFVERF